MHLAGGGNLLRDTNKSFPSSEVGWNGKFNKSGFRLPTRPEREYATRY